MKKRIGLISIVFLVLFSFLALYLIYVAVLPRLTLIGRKTDHKVYVAFGFHGNLYHSYRIDTNDEAGFGKDIRIIRRIIKALDDANRKGVPVKGVWDIENLFSLEEQLPRYAPDIISDLQRRVKENGDDVIIMSYNNGLASALNEKEFRTTVRRAVSNSAGSGVKDLFERWSPIVRPQEMMTTPGNFRLYQEEGIKAIALYNSAVTFDAFRVFTRRLPRKEAHNPLYYVNKESGEKMVLIPTYNHGDCIENVRLGRWVRQLHREQLRGNIDTDVLLYINADADDSFWYGYDLPPYLAWLPNTGGLDQFIDELKDIEYVEFTNLSDYLASHPPVGEISFGQDTADGSFNGYVSWSEKAYCHDYWTEVVKSRRIESAVNNIMAAAGEELPGNIKKLLAMAFEKRLRIQSTTNFGLATPFLARTRERVVEGVIRDLNGYLPRIREFAWEKGREILRGQKPPAADPGLSLVDSFLLAETTENIDRTVTPVHLPLKNPVNGNYTVFTRSGDQVPSKLVEVVTAENGKAPGLNMILHPEEPLTDRVLFLYRSEGTAPNGDFSTEASASLLKNSTVTVEFEENGLVKRVSKNGGKMLEEESLAPRIYYNDKTYGPESVEITILNDGSNGIATVQMAGTISIGEVPETEPGNFEYTLSLVDGLPYLFIDGNVLYPDTPRDSVFRPDKPALARKYDKRWQQVAPVELSFAPRASTWTPFKVLKRNYLGVETTYVVDYYRHSRENLNLANVNNHITAEYVGLAGKKSGIAVGINDRVLANFAGVPMKMTSHWHGNSFSMKLNPFGTYFGKQYIQPTWGHRQGYESGINTAAQYQSSAPTYSGYGYKFSLMVTFFEGREIPEESKRDLISFARSPYAITGTKVQAVEKKPVSLEQPRGFMAIYGDKGLYFHWEKSKGEAVESYVIQCGKSRDDLAVTFTQAGDKSTLLVDEYKNGEPFTLGETYYATIKSVSPDGTVSPETPVTSFVPEEPKSGGVSGAIPVSTQLKLVWFAIQSYFD